MDTTSFNAAAAGMIATTTSIGISMLPEFKTLQLRWVTPLRFQNSVDIYFYK